MTLFMVLLKKFKVEAFRLLGFFRKKNFDLPNQYSTIKNFGKCIFHCLCVLFHQKSSNRFVNNAFITEINKPFRL